MSIHCICLWYEIDILRQRYKTNLICCTIPVSIKTLALVLHYPIDVQDVVNSFGRNWLALRRAFDFLGLFKIVRLKLRPVSEPRPNTAANLGLLTGACMPKCRSIKQSMYA